MLDTTSHRAVTINVENDTGQGQSESFVPVEALPARLEALQKALGGTFKSIRVVNAANGAQVTYQRREDGEVRSAWTMEEDRPEDGRKIKGNKKVGVIQELASALTSARHPGLTKEDLVNRIVLITGRDPHHVESTVRTQLSRLPKVDGLEIVKTRVAGRLHYYAH